MDKNFEVDRFSPFFLGFSFLKWDAFSQHQHSFTVKTVLFIKNLAVRFSSQQV